MRVTLGCRIPSRTPYSMIAGICFRTRDQPELDSSTITPDPDSANAAITPQRHSNPSEEGREE